MCRREVLNNSQFQNPHFINILRKSNHQCITIPNSLQTQIVKIPRPTLGNWYTCMQFMVAKKTGTHPKPWGCGEPMPELQRGFLRKSDQHELGKDLK